MPRRWRHLTTFRRYPRQPGAMSQVDYMRIAEAAAQEVAEIRALTGWRLGEGCPTVALLGLSMGAWLAGMTVCRDAHLAAVVTTAPVVHSNPSYADRIVNSAKGCHPSHSGLFAGRGYGKPRRNH